MQDTINIFFINLALVITRLFSRPQIRNLKTAQMRQCNSNLNSFLFLCLLPL